MVGGPPWAASAQLPWTAGRTCTSGTEPTGAARSGDTHRRGGHVDAWDDFGPDDDQGHPPLTMEERAGVLDDLAELEVFRTLLEPTGVKGIVVDCPDCEEEHHVDWALMQANLQQLLEEGQTGRHEPP